jgi:hypothetical protein
MQCRVYIRGVFAVDLSRDGIDNFEFENRRRVNNASVTFTEAACSGSYRLLPHIELVPQIRRRC